MVEKNLKYLICLIQDFKMNEELTNKFSSGYIPTEQEKKIIKEN